MTTGIMATAALSATLQAATEQDGNYSCGLSNGLIITFGSATYASGSDWITLVPLTTNPNNPSGVASTMFTNFPNGIEVRIDAIVWVANSPSIQVPT